ncbi:peroxidasin-like [Tropilaelaps mercedesae]|uniref:Peroxidasin-like n=1 Tax=Tropilaelaps mercedesae TaxID=418985 RepID=A0A1V9XCM6_9ACAR|nr:peroxidasin-like [Tropilaelaps mercedesae]
MRYLARLIPSRMSAPSSVTTGHADGPSQRNPMPDGQLVLPTLGTEESPRPWNDREMLASCEKDDGAEKTRKFVSRLVLVYNQVMCCDCAMQSALVALAVVALLALRTGAIVVRHDVSGDDPELNAFDSAIPDFSAEDRTEIGNEWDVWVSQSRLTGFKLSTVTTTMDRYKAKMAHREKQRVTAGMDEEMIARLEPLDCRESGPYRSFDGSCNNLFYACWGRAGETYGRLLPPDYADDYGAPRSSRKGYDLPNVRTLSRVMQGNDVQSSFTRSSVFTDMTTHFGQFLAHEVTSAAPYADKEMRDGKLVQINVNSLRVGSNQAMFYVSLPFGYPRQSPPHFVSAPVCCENPKPDAECHPIEVGDGDSFYGRGHCIELVRSQSYNSSETACPKNNAVKSDVREQLNAVTAFIDGSLIYGSTKKKAESLVHDDGSMKMDKNSRYIRGGLMPRSDSEGSCTSYYPG